MELKVKMKLNSTTEIEATFDGGDLPSIIKKATPLLEFDGKCGFCSDTNLTLTTRIAKGYKFTEYVCKNCGAKRPWGSHKEEQGGGYFLKPWEEKYEGKKE